MVPKIPKASKPCPHCRRWPVAPTDSYCAGCGQLSVELALKPERVILVSAFANSLERKIVLANNDSRDLTVRVEFNPPCAWLSCQPKQVAVATGKMAHLKIKLDPEKLPEGFRQATAQARLILNDNEKTFRSIEVVTRSGARPVIDQARFGELQEGKIQEATFGLRNDGGIPFRVERIEPVGSKQIGVGSLSLPLTVEPDQAFKIPVSWDTTIEDDQDPSKAGFQVHLAGGEVLTVPAEASVYRYRLVADPEQIDFEGSPKSSLRQTVALRNQGTIDVEISAIDADASWIRIPSTSVPFTLPAPTPSSQGHKSEFEVITDHRDLEPGAYRGKIKISTLSAQLEDLEIEVSLRVHTLIPYSDYIGIDFGTTHSVVAIIGKGEVPELVQDFDASGSESPLIPSDLLVHTDGTTQIGHKARIETLPDCTVRSLKRIMGNDEDIELGGKAYRPEELASFILKHLVDLAAARLFAVKQSYYNIQRAILTVPANFYDLQMQAILNAAELAELEVERETMERAAELATRDGQPVNLGIVLDEPSAAALYFLHYLASHRGFGKELEEQISRKNGLHLLVFDYGGGTLDISVARISIEEDGTTILHILAAQGDNQLGGDHLDILLLRDFAADALAKFPQFDHRLILANHREIERRRKAEKWSESDYRDFLQTQRAWKDTVERLKIQLQHHEEASEALPPGALCHFENGRLVLAPGTFELTLTRTQLEKRLGPNLDRGIRLIHSALGLAKLTAEDIDYVLHAGRQSLMVAVKDRVDQVFPEAAEKNRIFLEEKELLKTCVAKGAALYGQIRRHGARGKGAIRLIQDRRLPHSYGIDRLALFGELRFEEIIARGETFPIEKEKVFEDGDLPVNGLLKRKLYTRSGNSERIGNTEEIRPVGEFEHAFDPDQDQQIRIFFSIDKNRRLLVRIGDHEIPIRSVLPSGDTDWPG